MCAPPSGPPSDNSDCSTFYVRGRVLTIESSNSAPGRPMSSTTFVRSFGTDTSFLGQSVQQVIDQVVTGQSAVTSIYIQEKPTEWIELGSTSTSSGSSSGNSWQPAVHHAKQWSIGQTMNYSGQNMLTSGGLPFLTVSAQISVTLVRREDVTVPAGTFNTCVFHTDSTSTNSLSGTAKTSSDIWIAPNVGEAKQVITSGTTTITQVLRRVQ